MPVEVLTGPELEKPQARAASEAVKPAKRRQKRRRRYPKAAQISAVSAEAFHDTMKEEGARCSLSR